MCYIYGNKRGNRSIMHRMIFPLFVVIEGTVNFNVLYHCIKWYIWRIICYTIYIHVKVYLSNCSNNNIEIQYRYIYDDSIVSSM